jgi:N-acetylneuraminic acid mutarotase
LFFVPEDTSPGEYLLKFEVTNLRSGLKTEKEVTINVVPRPVITKIEPQSGQIGAKITIFGSGFSTDDKNPNFIEFLSPQNGVSFMLKAVSNDGQTLEVAIPQNYCEKGFVGDCGTAEVFPVIPGRYKIYVSAYGAISNSEEFIIKEETPTISLSAMPTQGQAPLSVTFTATLENFRDKCNTLVWYFGDGNTQEQSICTTTATTTHTYNNAGAFGAKVNINKISSNLVTIDVKSPPGVWIKKTDFKGGSRSDAVGFAIGNKGYIGLGRDRINRTYKNDFWEYDPINGTWTQKADFPGTPRCCAVGFSIGNKGYVGTGVSNLPLKDFWEYDPLENKWIRKADFRGGERFGAVGFAIGNKGYVGLGSSLIYHNDFWEFNPSVGTLGTWTQKADFPGTPRCCAVGFSIGNKGYVGTGVGGTSNILLKDFWEFNPIFNQWVRKADFEGGAMQKAVGFSIGDKGYVGLGRIPGSAKLKTDFWEYNSLSDQWIQKTSFPGNPGCCAVGFSIGNKGYVGLERDSSYQSINDFWEFDPTAIPEKGFKRINDLMASILEIISQIVDEINKLIEK